MFKFATTALLATSAVALSLNSVPPSGSDPDAPSMTERLAAMHNFFDANDDGNISVTELSLALKIGEKAGYITFKDACESAYLFMTLSIEHGDEISKAEMFEEVKKLMATEPGFKDRLFFGKTIKVVERIISHHTHFMNFIDADTDVDGLVSIEDLGDLVSIEDIPDDMKDRLWNFDDYLTYLKEEDPTLGTLKRENDREVYEIYQAYGLDKLKDYKLE